MLNQVESLKSFLLQSVRSTDKMQASRKERHLPEGIKKPMEVALKLLVEEGIITIKESRDIQTIIDFRNEIGHSIHNLTSDISFRQNWHYSSPAYDYGALQRLQKYRNKIERGMSKKFWLIASPRDVIFEETGQVYEEELRRLRKKIARQYAKEHRN